MSAPRRGYSKDHPIPGDAHKYTVLVPQHLWRRVLAASRRTGVSVRARVLRDFDRWVNDTATRE